MSAQRYLVTARKYRPQIFSELVAQEHVTETLKNAIRLDRLAHSYLFSGPRGVGKTTAARILAKAINCTTPLEDREGNAEPCRECDSCRTFEEGRSLNIIEIDAASNNRVDDIRDLRETVRIPPQGGRKKVYIVDEVHMLSAAAFNALLKTLEEPPPHVLFIFATTEPHKVLPTILSRCQRFDFRRISVPEIVGRLKDICAEEDITADEASLMLIARKGDGALRDALSVFDQAVSLCGSDIKYADLAQALGVVDIDLYFEVTDRVADQDAAGMLRLVERTVRSGHDLQEFLAGLGEHLRNLLVARSMEDTSLIEAAEQTRERYASASQHFEETDILRLLTLAENAEERLKETTQPRLKVETALLKMASITMAADLREALDQIARLEQLAREGKLPTDGGGSASKGGPAATEPSASTRGSSPGPKNSGSRSGSNGGAQQAKDTSRSVDEARSAKSSASSPSANATASSPSGDATASNSSGDATASNSSAEATASNSSAEATASNSSAEAAASRPPATATDEKAERRTKTAVDAPPSAPLNARRAAPAKTGEPAGVTTEPGIAPPKAAAPAAVTSASRKQASHVLGKPALKRAAGEARQPGSETADAEEVASDAGPIERVWTETLERVKNDKIQVWSLLHHARPEGYRDEQAVIAVPNDFHRRVLTSQEEYVLSHLKPLVEVPVRSLQFVIREDIEAAEAEETASEFDPYEYMQKKRQENPVIRAIFDQFGGELVW